MTILKRHCKLHTFRINKDTLNKNRLIDVCAELPMTSISYIFTANKQIKLTFEIIVASNRLES